MLGGARWGLKSLKSLNLTNGYPNNNNNNNKVKSKPLELCSRVKIRFKILSKNILSNFFKISFTILKISKTFSIHIDVILINAITESGFDINSQDF
jgi:hypothetical protein